MGFSNLVAQFLRPQAAVKTSRAGPMIAWSHVGQPQWTPRRMANLGEEGFRKNVIAYRCVMQIATAAAAVPWVLYDEQGNELDQHPVLDLLAHPNPTQDGVTFVESLYANLQIFGNAYIEAIRPHDDAAPVELYGLRPDRMKVIPGPAGLPQGYQYNVNGQVTNWAADPINGASNILHLKQFHPLDDWYGLAPMEAALQSIDQHNASGAWNQALLNQGARPSGALVYSPKDGSPATLSDDQLQRLREEMGQLYQGDRNAGRPLILEGGLDWREMSLSPKDMDWLSGRNNAARDIALAFGVPAQLIGLPDAQSYANFEQARLAFYEETVLPQITRVIAGIDHWLCPMYRDRPELDFDPDSISALTDKRQAQWSKIQNANFLTRNEKREASGYGPVPGGDEDGDSGSDDDGGAKYAPRPKYSPDQPRVPAGNPGGGQWTSGGDEDEGDGDNNNENASNNHQETINNESGGSNDDSHNNHGSGVTPAAYHPTQFDTAGAVDKLNQDADTLKAQQIANGQPNLYGEGKCAHYVADAIEQGGGLPATQRPGEAKNFGPWLENNNFGAVATWNGPSSDGQSSLPKDGYVSGYTPQAGDVAVIQPYDGGNPAGHMDMYNGSQWVSDFRQYDIWGGPGYRFNQPPYVIYRYGVNSTNV